MNILIINQPPFNRGDESAHKALIRTLLKRLPNANFRVLTKFEWKESIRQYAVEDERVSYVFEPVSYLKLSGFINIGLQKNRKWLWKIHPMMNLYKVHYKWADLVLCAPGGICMGGFRNGITFLCYIWQNSMISPLLIMEGRSDLSRQKLDIIESSRNSAWKC